MMSYHFVLRCLGAALLLLATSQHATAQPLATAALPQQLTLLNNRAVASFPAAAISSARPTDLMSADRNANLETRVVFDAQASRLVFFAQELFATGDQKALTQFSEQTSEKGNDKTTILTDKDQLFTVLSTPTDFDTTQAAIRINSLLVKLPDNTVFRIAAYINPAAFARRAEFTALAARVFGSLKAGPRQVKRTAHVETHAVLGSAKKLRFNLPADYAISIDQKYDFQVFKFQQYQPLGTSGRKSLTVYVGRHPSYFFRDLGFERDEAHLTKGKFLGQPVNWLRFANPNKALYVQEQQLDGSPLGPGLTLHVGMVGSSETVINELDKIATDISVAK